jgi:hypothetical protein
VGNRRKTGKILKITPENYLNYHPPSYALPNIYSTDSGKQKYLKLLSELNGRSNCSVITLRSLQEIVPNISDEELFRDHYHMTPKGSAFFTPWLANQMQKDPNIITALKMRQKLEEFFIKKYAKKSYRKMTSYFKKKTETNVKIAQPSNNPVK